MSGRPVTRSVAAKKRKNVTAAEDRKRVRVLDEHDELHYAYDAVNAMVDLGGIIYADGEKRASDEFWVVREHPVRLAMEQLHIELKKRVVELPPSDAEARQIRLDRCGVSTMSTPEHPFLVDMFDGRRWHIDLDVSGRLNSEWGPGFAARLFSREPMFNSQLLDVHEYCQKIREDLGRRFMAVLLLGRAVLTGERQQTFECGKVVYAHNPMYESRLTKTGAFVTQYSVRDNCRGVLADEVQETLVLNEDETQLAGVVVMIDLEQADTSNAFQFMPCLLRSTNDYECILGIMFRANAFFDGIIGGDPLRLGKGFCCIIANDINVYAGSETCGFAFAFTLIDALLRRLNQLSRLIVQFHNDYVMPFHAIHKSRERTHELFNFVLRTWLPSPKAIVFHEDQDGSPRFYFHPHADNSPNLACDVDKSIHSLNALVGVATLTREQLAPLFFGVVVEFLAHMRESRDFFRGDLADSSHMAHRQLRLGDAGGRDYLPAKLHALGSRMIAHIHDGTAAPDAYESLRALLRSECLRERDAYQRFQTVSLNSHIEMSDLQAIAPLQSMVLTPWLRSALRVACNAWNIGGCRMGTRNDDVMRSLDTAILEPAIDLPLSFANAVCARAIEDFGGVNMGTPLWRCVLKTTAMGQAFGDGTTIAVVEQFFRDLLLHTAFEYDAEKQLLLLRSGNGGPRCDLCHTESDTLLLSHDCVGYLTEFDLPLSTAAMRPCLFATYIGHRTILEAVLLAALHSVRLPYRLDPALFFDNPAERLEALHAMNAFQLRNLFGDMSCDDLRALDMGFDNGHRDAYERAIANEVERVRSFQSIFERDTLATARAWRRDCVRMPVAQLLCGFGYTAQPSRTDRMSFDMAMQLLDISGVVNLVADNNVVLMRPPDDPETGYPTIKKLKPAVYEGMRRLFRDGERNVWSLRQLVQDARSNRALSDLDRSILDMYEIEQEQLQAFCALRVVAFLCKWLEESDDKRRAAFYRAVTAREAISPYDTARAAQDVRIVQKRALFDTLRESVDGIDGNLYRVPKQEQLARIKTSCVQLCAPLPLYAEKRVYLMPRSTPPMAVQIHNTIFLEPLPSHRHELPKIMTCAHKICFCDDYVDYAQFCGDMDHVLASALDGFQIA